MRRVEESLKNNKDRSNIKSLEAPGKRSERRPLRIGESTPREARHASGRGRRPTLFDYIASPSKTSIRERERGSPLKEDIERPLHNKRSATRGRLQAEEPPRDGGELDNTIITVEDGKSTLIRQPGAEHSAGKAPATRYPLATTTSVEPLEEASGEWWLQEIDDIVDAVEGYVIDVKYDGSVGKAVVYVLDPSENRIVRWYDKTGHIPYFLVRADPEELGSPKLGITKHESFRGFSTVEKYDALRRSRVRLTRINVSDPLAVRDLRSRLEKQGIRFYEADIKYHQNYIYDNQIIPALPHRLGKSIERLGAHVDEETIDKVRRAFEGEPKEIIERALHWMPIFEEPPPNVRRVAFDIEVYTPFEGELPDPESAPFPVISIAVADGDGLLKVFLLDRPDFPDTRLRAEELEEKGVEVEIYDSELALILDALKLILSYHIVFSFNGDNFDLPYLYNRLIVLGYPPSLIPFEFRQDTVSFRNNLHVDLYKFFDIRALQVYAFGNSYREKNLDTIAEALLGEKKVSLEKPISELDAHTLVLYNATDADLTIRLTRYANNLVWNLIVLLMRISKLGLEDVTRTQVSGWIRSLMHWEHRKRGYLIPSKEEINELSGSAKSTAIIKDKKYQGAIVLEPPQGVFFNILVLDFASLYPSIIKNWNLSYETVNNPYCRGEKLTVPEVGHTVCMDLKGITSEIVGLLRDFRVKIYKKRAKDKSLDEITRLWYNTVQAAMKVYINASYGVFGNEAFNYYSLAVAESVTAIGRNVLKSTVRKAESLDLMILYGDTDSIFLWDPPREKLDEIIGYVKREFGLDLEIDKEFKLGLFSGLKKNYIGVNKDGSVVIKGMVGKKSNTPEFLKKEFADATRLLAHIAKPEDVFSTIDKLKEHIREINRKLKRKRYTLDELAIKVMLSKDPREYTKNTPQHVKAALLLKKYGIRVTKGTVVTYVKTRDALGVRPVKLARLAEVDPSKYQELVRTAFEQMLASLGVSWESIEGQKKLLFPNL